MRWLIDRLFPYRHARWVAAGLAIFRARRNEVMRRLAETGTHEMP